MRLLFVADGRSPIALNWIRFFIDHKVEVHLASTFPCKPLEGLASFELTPAAFSQVKKPQPAGKERTGSGKGIFWGATTIRLRTWIRQWFGPITLPSAAKRLSQYIQHVQPDLVHAMRIPYEGMLAALALDQVVNDQTPLLLSVWGNDFTLHAPSNPWMRRLTRQSVQRAGAVHTDCYRDARLARAWGLEGGKPVIVLPGGGGIQLGLFTSSGGEPLSVAGNALQTHTAYSVINPRGFRAYVRNDTFFRSIPIVLERFPQGHFVCTTMAGEPRAQRWVSDLGLEGFVDLLPVQPRLAMAELFRRSQVVVSPTTHDGTPNTLLESMACGCFPVVSDLESLREWITPGVNGLLFDPGDPRMLAEMMLLALENPLLRRVAADKNRKLVAERADYNKVMKQALDFTRQLGQK